MGTMQVFFTSFAMAIFGYALLFILMCAGVNSVAVLLIPAFFIFMAFGMLTVLTTVFLANTVDYGEIKNNRRDESVIFSMQTFVVKLASGVAALIASICLSICNLSDDTSDVEAAVDAVKGSSVVGLRMTMTVLPIIGLLAALVIFKKKYILTEEKVAEIAAELKRQSN
jgi:melibiose permease